MKNGLLDKFVGTVSPIIQSIAKTITHSRSDNNLDSSFKLFNCEEDDKRTLYSNSKKRRAERFPIIHDSNINYMPTFDEQKSEFTEQINLRENKDFKNTDDCKIKRKSITM